MKKTLGDSVTKSLKKALREHGLKLGASSIHASQTKDITSLVINVIGIPKKRAKKK